MKLTKEAKIAPRNIAEAITKNINKTGLSEIDISGPGFINLKLDWNTLEETISEINDKGSDFAQLNESNKPETDVKSILLEYVSANPTGDLHLGHGRQAVLGSALAKLFKKAGYKVQQEFYINDAGAQMEKLAHSCRQAIFIQEGLMPATEYDDTANYPLESMLEFITPEKYQAFLEEHTHHSKEKEPDEYLACLTRVPDGSYGYLAEQIFLQAQKEILAEVKTEFDLWFSEREHLHKREDADFHTKVSQCVM